RGRSGSQGESRCAFSRRFPQAGGNFFSFVHNERSSDRIAVIPMDFGYFTLSDNHYDNNTRSANQFVQDILAEAVHADQLGMHSAWIGEHHFSTLGVLSCPDLVLSNVAARTKRIRLAP